MDKLIALLVLLGIFQLVLDIRISDCDQCYLDKEDEVEQNE